MENLLMHSQTFVIAVDEVDYRERLKISAIQQYFQDLATVHATFLGIGYEEMKEKNLLWILSRLSAKIYRYPALGDTITVTTYPRKPNLVDAVRDYYIYDETGNLLIAGTSKWCVIDAVNHAIRRCSPIFSYSDDQYISTEPFEGGNQQLSKLEDGAGNTTKLFDVNITDLDRNQHMNNARYGDFIVNSCTIEQLNQFDVARFDINFLSELKVGDKPQVNALHGKDESFFEALKDGRPVFRARIGWKEYARN